MRAAIISVLEHVADNKEKSSNVYEPTTEASLARVSQVSRLCAHLK